MTDLLDFLVQADGKGALTQFNEVLSVRRRDWGPSGDPLGYCASENVQHDATTIFQTWSYGANPFKFTASNGDGGQIIVWSNGRAIFWATQDGSYNGLQYFVGPECPSGVGWLLFDQSDLSSSWTAKPAPLAISKIGPFDCPPLTPSYTRYMVGPCLHPFQFNGQEFGSFSIPTIITEHYNNSTIAASTAMERNFFAQGWGNLRWESWGTTGVPGNNLVARLPVVTVNGYYYPETTGWYLLDGRNWTNFTPAPTDYSVAAYGWPP